MAPARRERPRAQVPLVEGIVVGVPRDAGAELAPHDRYPDLVADDGAHRPPPLQSGRPLGSGRLGRRRWHVGGYLTGGCLPGGCRCPPEADGGRTEASRGLPEDGRCLPRIGRPPPRRDRRLTRRHWHLTRRDWRLAGSNGRLTRINWHPTRSNWYLAGVGRHRSSSSWYLARVRRATWRQRPGQGMRRWCRCHADWCQAGRCQAGRCHAGRQHGARRNVRPPQRDRFRCRLRRPPPFSGRVLAAIGWQTSLLRRSGVRWVAPTTGNPSVT